MSVLKLASYADVQAKATQIFRNGGVEIVTMSPSYTEGRVTSTSGQTYMTLLGFTENLGVSGDPKDKLKEWTCECPWGKWNYDRSAPYAHLEGRLCAHALALLYAVQSVVYKTAPALASSSCNRRRSGPSSDNASQ